MRRRGFELRLYFLGLPSRLGELCLKFLELPLQQLGLTFEPLDLGRVRRLRSSGGGMEQQHAQKRGACHQLLFEVHDHPLERLASATPREVTSPATIAVVDKWLMTNR